MTGILDPSYVAGVPYADNDQLSDRSTSISWVKRRREDRDLRRAELARGRTAHRLARLGEAWKVLDVSELGINNPDTFLAIGPGGVFSVSVKPQGRTRVRLAGDVVQIEGKRHTYVAEARKVAKSASDAISATAAQRVPVTPIIAFAGTGLIDVHGLPKGVVVTSHRELDHLLTAYGERISHSTVNKLYAIARHPVTWVANDAVEPQISTYTWYSDQSHWAK